MSKFIDQTQQDYINQQEAEAALQRIADRQRPRQPQHVPNPMFHERLEDMLLRAMAEGRELHLSDITDPDMQRWVACKLALEKKPKGKIPGRKRRKV